MSGVSFISSWANPSYFFSSSLDSIFSGSILFEELIFSSSGFFNSSVVDGVGGLIFFSIT